MGIFLKIVFWSDVDTFQTIRLQEAFMQKYTSILYTVTLAGYIMNYI